MQSAHAWFNNKLSKEQVIVKSHYEKVIVVITRVRGGAEDECKNNDNDLTGFYSIVFDVRHVMQ